MVNLPPEKVWSTDPLFAEMEYQRKNYRTQPIVSGFIYELGHENPGPLYRRIGQVKGDVRAGETLSGGIEAAYAGTSSLPGSPQRKAVSVVTGLREAGGEVETEAPTLLADNEIREVVEVGAVYFADDGVLEGTGVELEGEHMVSVDWGIPGDQTIVHTIDVSTDDKKVEKPAQGRGRGKRN